MLMASSINHVRHQAAVKQEQTTLVPSTVVSAKATDIFGHYWERYLTSETVEKVTKSRSSEADSHVDSSQCL